MDGAGRWIEGHTLNWDRLPMRVEGVIEKCLGQALRVASVEGQEFTAYWILAGERAHRLSAPQEALLRSTG
jgi:hypothetical protein